jgi:hypothetical protein
MSLRAVVELTPDGDGALPSTLAAEAYAVSREGRVMLVLNGLDAAAADALVDPAVPALGLSVYGVSYVDVTDSEAIITAARAARMVAVSSPQLLELLRRYGIHDVHVMAPAGAPEGGAAARTMIRVPSRRRQP